MKVIMVKTVPGFGRPGDIREASGGYARNFLFPKGLAEPATGHKIRMREQSKAKQERVGKENAEKKRKIARKVDGTVLEVHVEGKKGRLYSAIGPKTVSDRLKAEGFDVSPEEICFAEKIKSAGDYDIGLKLGGAVARIKLVVVPEKEEGEMNKN